MIETRTKYSLRCEKCSNYFLGSDNRVVEYNNHESLTLDARRHGWIITSKTIVCADCAYKHKYKECIMNKELIKDIFFVKDDFKVEHYQLVNKEMADWLIYKEKRDDGKTSIITFTLENLKDCLNEKARYFLSKEEALLKLIDDMKKLIEVKDGVIDELDEVRKNLLKKIK